MREPDIHPYEQGKHRQVRMVGHCSINPNMIAGGTNVRPLRLCEIG
jgi:hypothetical protein